jgi:hypothetical protein
MRQPGEGRYLPTTRYEGGRVIAMQVWIRKEGDTLDREYCPSFSASSASERKVFRTKCLIERISLVIGFFLAAGTARGLLVLTLG